MSLKSIVSVERKKLEKLRVAEKFKFAFNNVQHRIIILLVLIIVLGITSASSIFNIYNTYYMENKWQGEIRVDIQDLAKEYIWAYAATDEWLKPEKESEEDYIDEDQMAMIPNPMSEKYARLDALNHYYENHKENAPAYMSKCDVLTQFRKMKWLMDY